MGGLWSFMLLTRSAKSAPQIVLPQLNASTVLEMTGSTRRAPPAPPPSSTDQAMEATMLALAGARLVGGPATAAERAATGVDTYLVDSDSDEEAETTTAIADFERRLAARQPPPSSAAPVAAPQQRLPATNSKR